MGLVNNMLVYNRDAKFSSYLHDAPVIDGNRVQATRQLASPVCEGTSKILDASPSTLSDHTDTSSNKFLSYLQNTPAIDGNLAQAIRQLAPTMCKGTSMMLDASPSALSFHTDTSSNKFLSYIHDTQAIDETWFKLQNSLRCLCAKAPL